MKTRTAIVAAIVALLLLATVVLAQPSRHDASKWYTVEKGTASGGGYHLISLTWEVNGTASGPGYRLPGPVALTGSGCCCAYLPCVLKNY